jgi:hypothetical protein
VGFYYNCEGILAQYLGNMHKFISVKHRNVWISLLQFFPDLPNKTLHAGNRSPVTA